MKLFTGSYRARQAHLPAAGKHTVPGRTLCTRKTTLNGHGLGKPDVHKYLYFRVLGAAPGAGGPGPGGTETKAGRKNGNSYKVMIT